jgi:putative flavoprotein involved in K+ transport
MSEHASGPRTAVAIVGGGPAGLALSYHLKALDCDHLVLEQGRVAEHWRSKRWDSLRLVAPNWHFRLPGLPYSGDDPDGFMGRDEVVARLEEYARTFALPVCCNRRVTGILPHPAGHGFLIATTAEPIAARQVVLATGAYRTPRLPTVHNAVPPIVHQIHAGDYRRPAQLPPGAVLVVGSGESGCQIADELRRAGRAVFLAVGRSFWLPRRYRGRDSISWLMTLGAFDQTVGALPGGRASAAPPGPQLTGHDGGRDLNLHTLARTGVTLLGRLQGIRGHTLVFTTDLHERIAAGDAAAADFCAAVDEHVRVSGVAAPPEHLPRYAEAYTAAPASTLDIAAAGIAALIWATGYRPDFGWLKLPISDAQGYPLQRRGVASYRGLYFLGLEWQHSAQSHIFPGLGADAAYLAPIIAARGRGN